MSAVTAGNSFDGRDHSAKAHSGPGRGAPVLSGAGTRSRRDATARLLPVVRDVDDQWRCRPSRHALYADPAGSARTWGQRPAQQTREFRDAHGRGRLSHSGCRRSRQGASGRVFARFRNRLAGGDRLPGPRAIFVSHLFGVAGAGPGCGLAGICRHSGLAAPGDCRTASLAYPRSRY